MDKKAIIVGASSGIGNEVARQLLSRGWECILVARRQEPLEALAKAYPGKVQFARIDITEASAHFQLQELMEATDGLSLYFHASGCGWQNPTLDHDTEQRTIMTNALGFTSMIDAAFRHMATHGGGHIAAITSIAGTRGLGMAPAYSASKAYGTTYLEALQQLARLRQLPITITDIRPGFVDTALLADGRSYPLLMSPANVARDIIKAITKKTPVRTIDWRYRILVFFWRLIPRFVWVRLPIRNG